MTKRLREGTSKREKEKEKRRKKTGVRETEKERDRDFVRVYRYYDERKENE